MLTLALLLAAAVQNPAPPQASNPGAADACAIPPGANFYWPGPNEVAPGERVRLRPSWLRGPGSDQLPQGCVRWSIPPAIGAISADGSALEVSPTAEDGAKATLSARLGTDSIPIQLRVVDPKKHPLFGTWRQQSANCPPHHGRPYDLVGELAFGGGGRFSMTWSPFESFVDYLGSYDYDPRSHRLKMAVDGGDTTPKHARLEGLAVRKANGALELRGISFGESPMPAAPPSCVLTFVQSKP
jgi:hypothetical protein